MNFSALPPVKSGLTASIVAVLAIVGLAFGYWRLRDNLYFADFWARHWKIRQWRRHTGGIENLQSWAKEGLPPPEKELCDYYLRYIRGVNERDFDRAMNYLAITQQSSTTPIAVWAVLILFILTAAEAATTGAFIAPFISRLSTGNEITYLGFIGAIVLAVMLLGFTHASGRQMRRRVAIKNNIGPYATSEKGFFERTITSGMDQEQDHDKPVQMRFANRVLNGAHDRGKIGWSVACVLTLSALLIAIFLGRVWENNLVATKASMDQNGSACARAGAGPTSASDPFASMNNAPASASPKASGGSIPGFAPGVTAPPDVTCSAQAAQHKGMDEATYDELMAGDAAAFILAIIYLLTQAMGFYFAYTHAFYGDGEKAYETTRGEPTYLSFRTRYLEPALQRASALLTVLRSELTRRVQQYGRFPSSMTMDEYYDRRSRAGQGSAAYQPLPAPLQPAYASPPLPPAPEYAPPPAASAAPPSARPAEAPSTYAAAPATGTDDLLGLAARRILAAHSEEEKLGILAAASSGDPQAEARIISIAHAMKDKDGRDAQRRNMLKGL